MLFSKVVMLLVGFEKPFHMFLIPFLDIVRDHPGGMFGVAGVSFSSISWSPEIFTLLLSIFIVRERQRLESKKGDEYEEKDENFKRDERSGF